MQGCCAWAASSLSLLNTRMSEYDLCSFLRSAIAAGASNPCGSPPLSMFRNALAAGMSTRTSASGGVESVSTDSWQLDGLGVSDCRIARKSYSPWNCSMLFRSTRCRTNDGSLAVSSDVRALRRATTSRAPSFCCSASHAWSYWTRSSAAMDRAKARLRRPAANPANPKMKTHAPARKSECSTKYNGLETNQLHPSSPTSLMTGEDMKPIPPIKNE
mmetsp:Transcript_25440/g.67405  ORF Transcript_25440/g.67405 Transcript_25440/m.67405 type:complete len:216 (-) Transcript_25440:38-685(-)